LVAAENGNILGLVSVHSFEMIHRPGRLGRITSRGTAVFRARLLRLEWL
jgi:hypothetical protein